MSLGLIEFIDISNEFKSRDLILLKHPETKKKFHEEIISLDIEIKITLHCIILSISKTLKIFVSYKQMQLLQLCGLFSFVFVSLKYYVILILFHFMPLQGTS